MKLFILVEGFEAGSGSYSGFFDTVARYASSVGYDVVILATLRKGQKADERLSYARVIRFKLNPISIPLIGGNNRYLQLAGHIKRYFEVNSLKDKDIIVANALACLGVLDKPYFLRMGQPARVFLRNLERAKGYYSPPTRAARWVHYNYQHNLEKKAVRNAKGWLFPSKETAELNQRIYDINGKPTFIPYSCIHASKPRQGDSNSILIVTAGTEKIRKGIVYLEKILPDLLKKFPQANITHVGDPILWEVPAWCKKKIKSVGKVSQNKMRYHYENSGFLLSPSLQEGFPNTILEAMAAGCPVASSDIEGISEYITHKKEGYIFKRADENSLKQALEFMLHNPKKVKEMGKASRERIAVLDKEAYLPRLFGFFSDCRTVNLLG